MSRKKTEIFGVGIDCVEVERVRQMRNMRRFAEYFLDDEELALFAQSADGPKFIASRFAAKEAVIKAFPGYLAPHDFRIVKDGKKPVVHFRSPVAEKNMKAFVSITYSPAYAIGYAVVMNA